MVNTVRFSRNLFVVGEDEYNNICAAASGNHPIDIIIYGIQSRLQDNILQLYHSGSQLRHVLLFHECSFSATCVDLTMEFVLRYEGTEPIYRESTNTKALNLHKMGACVPLPKLHTS